MLKRALDLLFAVPAAILSAPVVACLMLAIWLYDRGNPLYVPRRIGQDGKPLPVYKLRTMITGADKSGVDTTAKGDSRLLPFAEVLRRYKLDELPQFWNVILGSMSVVGPRPNVSREVDKYTSEERRLLTVKPGLTDLSSIVFSDLADRIAGTSDANLAYETTIRPWKSRLGLFYIDHRSVMMDMEIIAVTAVAIFNREKALRRVCALLARHEADADLRLEVCGRTPLVSHEVVP